MSVSGKKVIAEAKKHMGATGSFVWRYWGLQNGTPWCGAFVSYVFKKAGGKDLVFDGKPCYYVPYCQEWLKAHCKHVKMAEAKPGDIVIFTWDGIGYNAERGSRDHIGLIRAAGPSSMAYTIEGNTCGGHVANRTRPACYIYGIYRPNYPKTKKAAVKKTTVKAPAKKKVTYYVITTKDGMNVRKSPSVTSKRVAGVSCGEKIAVTKTKNGWMYAANYKGWVKKNESWQKRVK